MSARTESGAFKELTSGRGAAAILSSAIGCFALGVVAVVADKVQPVAQYLNLYRPTGPLSGVTTLSIFIWLGAWLVLHALWQERDIALRKINVIAILLLTAGLLLTFPPIGDLF